MALAQPAQLLRTEVEFTLPLGYVDQGGTLHRQGVMRLATAFDEVQPLQDSRVQANQAYLSILLLSRVVVKLGTLSPVPPAVVEDRRAGGSWAPGSEHPLTTPRTDLRHTASLTLDTLHLTGGPPRPALDAISTSDARRSRSSTISV